LSKTIGEKTLIYFTSHFTCNNINLPTLIPLHKNINRILECLMVQQQCGYIPEHDPCTQQPEHKHSPIDADTSDPSSTQGFGFQQVELALNREHSVG
jgi:hypothetical protein